MNWSHEADSGETNGDEAVPLDFGDDAAVPCDSDGDETWAS